MDWGNWIKAISSVLGTRTNQLRSKSPISDVRVSSPIPVVATSSSSTVVETPVSQPPMKVASSQKKTSAIVVKKSSIATAKPSPAAVRTYNIELTFTSPPSPHTQNNTPTTHRNGICLSSTGWISSLTSRSQSILSLDRFLKCLETVVFQRRG